MAGHTRLFRRGATYYHRAAIPKDIDDSYSKSEETFSLKTKDYKEALRLVKIAAVEVDQKFADHREYQKFLKKPKVDTLSKEQITAAGKAYYTHLLEEDDSVRIEDGFYDLGPPETLDDTELPEAPIPTFEEYEEDNLDAMASLRQMLARAKVDSHIKSEAKEVLSWTNVSIPLSEDSKSWRELELELLKQTMLANQQIGKRNQGEIVETPEQAVKLEVTPKLSEIMKDWLAEKALDKDGWREKTAMDNQKAIETFIECCGDKPMDSYTLSDIRNLKQILISLPPNWIKNKNLNNLHIKKAAKKAVKLELEPQSVSTINKKISFVGTFWRWAASNYEGVSIDIFQNMTIPNRRNRRADRDSFNIKELTKIFKSPIFTGCLSERRWAESGSFSMRRTAKFWVPLIALYTGARLGEILQLRVADVKCQNDIWYFELNEDTPDKKIKSRRARLIPIHAMLFKIGFSLFLKWRQSTKEDMLFPKIKLSQDGYYSSAYSKHFSRFLTIIGAKTRKNSFHSFRHNLKDAARNSGADMNVIDEIQGHQGNRTTDRYGSDYYLKTMKTEVDKIVIEGLSLDHLKT